MATIWDKIKNFTGDLTTLDVTTLKGTVKMANITVTDATGKKSIDFSKIFELLKAEPTADSKITLVAATRVKFDSDTINYFDESSPIDSDLIRLHLEAVKQAAEARAAFVRAGLSLIGGKG